MVSEVKEESGPVIFHKVLAIKASYIIIYSYIVGRHSADRSSRRIYSPLSSIFQPIRRSDALFRKRETYFRRCVNFTRVGKSDFLFCPRKIKIPFFFFFFFFSLSLSLAINNINRDISPTPSSNQIRR